MPSRFGLGLSKCTKQLWHLAFGANVQQVINGRDRITMVGIDTNPSNTTEFSPSNTPTDGLTNTGYTADDISVAGGAFLLGNIGMTKIKAIINSSVNDANTDLL